MAIIGYDPEKEEVSNDQKIKNCFSLSVIILVGMPILGLLIYFLKSYVVNTGYLSAESGQQIFGGYVILAIFLTVAILFTVGYLRRQLRKEKKQADKEAGNT